MKLQSYKVKKMFRFKNNFFTPVMSISITDNRTFEEDVRKKCDFCLIVSSSMIKQHTVKSTQDKLTIRKNDASAMKKVNEYNSWIMAAIIIFGSPVPNSAIEVYALNIS